MASDCRVPQGRPKIAWQFIAGVIYESDYFVVRTLIKRLKDFQD
ncbi:Uncharacterized protein dnm_067590 [Desulfonema magnum]|uniref:Uncharacterized protein n=1 Tax=Desulfonema magnum TaxID=45655 RepID=A0A975BSB0_9BACT|nr:Uncharacterized protein dnm_067590 [Desulfonema magnum]